MWRNSQEVGGRACRSKAHCKNSGDASWGDTYLCIGLGDLQLLQFSIGSQWGSYKESRLCVRLEVAWLVGCTFLSKSTRD